MNDCCFITAVTCMLMAALPVSADQKCHAEKLTYTSVEAINNDLLAVIGRSTAASSAYIETANAATSIQDADRAITNSIRTLLITDHAQSIRLFLSVLQQDILIRDSIKSKQDRIIVENLTGENLRLSIKAAESSKDDIVAASQTSSDLASQKIAAELRLIIEDIVNLERYCRG